jgi:hypothetical protein
MGTGKTYSKSIGFNTKYMILRTKLTENKEQKAAAGSSSSLDKMNRRLSAKKLSAKDLYLSKSRYMPGTEFIL